MSDSSCAAAISSVSRASSSASSTRPALQLLPGQLRLDDPPAVRIDPNSLATCFAFLLISERMVASCVCKYWHRVSESRQAWSRTYFYPANPRRLMRFPPFATTRVHTLDTESIMDECTERFSRHEEKDGIAEEDEAEEEDLNEEESAEAPTQDEDVDESEDSPNALEYTDDTSAVTFPPPLVPPSASLRRDRLWLRLLRHFRRFTQLSAFVITALRNNDVAQVLDAVSTARDTLTELRLAGTCHPARTCDSVREWRALAQFTRLERLFLPYTTGVPMMRTLIQHSASANAIDGVTPDTSAEVNSDGDATMAQASAASNRITLADEEEASLLVAWLTSLEGEASSDAPPSITPPAYSASSPPASLSFSLPSSVSSRTFSGLTSLGLKFWRPVYLSGVVAEEAWSRRQEHIYLRQLLAQLPRLEKLQVFGMGDEQCLESIACNPRLSKHLTTLVLGFHGAFRHRAWRHLERLNEVAPKLDSLVLRCAIPNERDEPDDEEGAAQPDTTTTTTTTPADSQRTMNMLLMQSIARIVSLKRLSLHFLHSVDEARIQIAYPRFFTSAEVSPLRNMAQLEQLEVEVVTRRTSNYLSRSFNPDVLSALLAPGGRIVDTMTHLTLFSPVMRDLIALDELTHLRVLKIISTNARIILKQRRNHVPTAAASTPPLDEDATDMMQGDANEDDDGHEMDVNVDDDLTELEQQLAHDEHNHAAPPAVALAPAASASSAAPPTVTGDCSSSDEDDQDENLSGVPRSSDEMWLRARCRQLRRAVEVARAREVGLPPPNRRVLYFTMLPALESLSLSNLELERDDFHTLSMQPNLTYLQLARCFVGKFRVDSHTTTQSSDAAARGPASEENKTNAQSVADAAIASVSSTAVCFALLAGAPKLARLNLAFPDAGGPTVGFMPPLRACASLTSLSLTNWPHPSSPDLAAIHGISKLRHLEFYMAEFRESQMALLLPPGAGNQSATRGDSTSSPSRPPHSSLRHLLLVGCGVLTPSEELMRIATGYTHAPRDSCRRHSATPNLTCAPLYAWAGLERFLDDCFEAGISVKHKRYY